MKRFCIIFVFSGAIALFYAASAWPAGFVVSAPEKNVKMEIGYNYRIRWQAQHISGYLKIILYRNMNRIGVIKEMVNIADGQYLWKAGEYGDTLFENPAGRYRIKLEAMAGAHVAEGYSEFFFLVPRITISSPEEGDIWQTGKKKTIAGSVKGYNGTFILELWENNHFKGRIAQGVHVNMNNGLFIFEWRVPDLLFGEGPGLLPGVYHVKAVAAQQPSQFDMSGPFTIILGVPNIIQHNTPLLPGNEEYEEHLKYR